MSQDPPSLLVALGGGHKEQQPWVESLQARLPHWHVVPLGGAVDPRAVRYVAAWKAPPGVWTGLTGLEAIFSLGAGVDHLLGDPALPSVPVVRVVDPDLRDRMSEWVVLHVLGHHRQTARYARQQRDRVWDDDLAQPAAKDVRVGLMGLGVLGADAAAKLQVMGFDVAGWSRSPKTLPRLRSYAGAAELDAFLAHSQILVVLLPLTPDTRNILDAGLFGKLARDGHLGAPVVLNAGRGGLQNEADILRCLDDGTLHAVTLDVFDTEPLPHASPLWGHPGVTVTPHNAAVSSPIAIADFIAGQIMARERGEPLRHVIDRTRNY